MPPEAPTSTGDRAASAALADLLAQGQVLHLLSAALCAGAAAAVFLVPGWRSAIGPAVILLAGLAETWMALRVGFDARCFLRISAAAEDHDLTAFDRSLMQLGLMPQSKAGRPIALRMAGAQRLLAIQGVMVMMQVAIGIVAALTF